MMYKLSFGTAVFLFSIITSANICPSNPEISLLGNLDDKILNETSGLAVSSQFKDRLYHINDSGGGPYFYITKADASSTQTVKVNNFTAIDLEDLALGSCGTETCLYLGDIGDNLKFRRSLRLIRVKEQADYSKTTEPYDIVKFRYPDGPHNAEGMALHPNGDFYIITKERNKVKKGKKKKVAQPAKLYRLTKKQLDNHNNEVQDLQHVGDLDFPTLLSKYNTFGKIITAFDISPDGKRILFLTYNTAVEIKMDLSKRFTPISGLKRNSEISVIGLVQLPQQEAIAYDLNGIDFIYSTESNKNANSTPLFKVFCSGN